MFQLYSHNHAYLLSLIELFNIHSSTSDIDGPDDGCIAETCGLVY
jgi:hypothetical protein